MKKGFPEALVPVDFSETSDRLIEWLPTTKQLGVSKVYLFHVIEEVKFEHPAAGYMIDEHIKQELKEAAEKLGKYKQDLEERKFATVEICDIYAGDPAHLIAKAADQFKVDLIIMGSSGKGWFKELIVGSTTRKVLRLASKPVLIVESNEPMPTKLETILGAIEVRAGEELDLEIGKLVDYMARTALAVEEATNTVPELIFLVINPERQKAGTVDRKMLRRNIAKLLNEKIGMNGFEHEVLFWVGSPVDEIVNAVLAFSADLLILSPHIKGEGKLLHPGSLAKELMKHLSVPILVYK
ncbi:MAG: universal stress protein [Desulfurococcales archaeon]|nr:universal stress protein [Desulfurococcales archaeon]